MSNSEWRESDWGEVRDLIIELYRNYPLQHWPGSLIDYELYIEHYKEEGLFRQTTTAGLLTRFTCRAYDSLFV
jgi:hypothetical protein